LNSIKFKFFKFEYMFDPSNVDKDDILDDNITLFVRIICKNP
jgi:hypothetical protein